MKRFLKLATLVVMVLAATAYGFSQPAKVIPANLVRGVVGPIGGNSSWSGYSALNLVPGAGLIPVTSSNTVF